MRDVNRNTFGADVIDRVSEGWGLDAEGEIKGCYRPIGHPAVSCSDLSTGTAANSAQQLWYAIGDFFNCRFMSKQLVRMHVVRNENTLTSSPTGYPHQSS